MLPVYESNIAALQCPSDPLVAFRFNETYQVDPTGARLARCSYAVCLGVGQMEGTIVPPSTLLSPTGLAFGQRVAGPFGYNYGARIADISDGTSNTTMLSELIRVAMRRRFVVHKLTTKGRFSWPTIAPTIPRRTSCAGATRKTASPAPRPPACEADARTAAPSALLNMVIHTSRSMHPGGVVTALCDGSTRFTSNTVSLRVWQSLATPDGGEMIPGDY